MKNGIAWQVGSSVTHCGMMQGDIVIENAGEVPITLIMAEQPHDFCRVALARPGEKYYTPDGETVANDGTIPVLLGVISSGAVEFVTLDPGQEQAMTLAQERNFLAFATGEGGVLVTGEQD